VWGLVALSQLGLTNGAEWCSASGAVRFEPPHQRIVPMTFAVTTKATMKTGTGTAGA
jgi:hypothetical protein